ncbi:hypothetical protein Bca101_076831 [Brassica carinata]
MISSTARPPNSTAVMIRCFAHRGMSKYSEISGSCCSRDINKTTPIHPIIKPEMCCSFISHFTPKETIIQGSRHGSFPGRSSASTSPGRTLPGLDRTQYCFGVQKRQSSFRMERNRTRMVVATTDPFCHLDYLVWTTDLVLAKRVRYPCHLTTQIGNMSVKFRI